MIRAIRNEHRPTHWHRAFVPTETSENASKVSCVNLYLCTAFRTTLSVGQTVQRRMIGRLMNVEPERVFKQAVVVFVWRE
jgi:hypothetical protein